MKRLHIIAIAVLMAGCSKESDLVIEESTNNKQMSEEVDWFQVGVVNPDGSPVITYDIQQLSEVAACAVYEGQSENLHITHSSTSGYFLRGNASSQGSATAFGVLLSEENGVLYWENNASIFTCYSEDGSVCDLNIVDANNFTCSGSSPSCDDDLIGGGGDISYGVCTTWPWAVKQQDTKKKK